MTLVRDGAAGDLDSIRALDAALFGPDAWHAAMSAEFDGGRDDRAVLVAVGHAGIVGYAILRLGPDTADVLRVGVDSDHQRAGVASTLLAGLVARSVGAGCQRLLLEVASDNAAALGLYRRLGFTAVADRPRYYSDGGDAVVMQLDLSAQGLDEEGEA